MAVYRWERCPYCKKTLSLAAEYADDLLGLGPEFATCPNCKKTHRTRAQEWARMSTGGRAVFWIKTVLLSVVGGVVLWGAGALMTLMGIFAGLEYMTGKENLFLWGNENFLLMLGICLPFAMFGMYRRFRYAKSLIVESLERVPLA